MGDKTKPTIGHLDINIDEKTEYSLEWALSAALKNHPDPDCGGRAGVLSFLDEVASFALQILRNRPEVDYDAAIHEAYGVAFTLGSDPAAHQLRRAWPGGAVPLEVDIAVELFSHATAARRCIADKDAVGAFYHGQMVQVYLQQPDTIDIRNKISGNIPKKDSPSKAAGRKIFDQYKKNGEKLTWKILLKALESRGFTPKTGTVQRWLTEFRS